MWRYSMAITLMESETLILRCPGKMILKCANKKKKNAKLTQESHAICISSCLHYFLSVGRKGTEITIRIMQRKIWLFPMSVCGLTALSENVKNISLKNNLVPVSLQFQGPEHQKAQKRLILEFTVAPLCSRSPYPGPLVKKWCLEVNNPTSIFLPP